jgi:hypothetical protein
MLTQRAIEILAKYEILERNLNKQEKVEAFRQKVEGLAFIPATKQTRLVGIQGR